MAEVQELEFRIWVVDPGLRVEDLRVGVSDYGFKAYQDFIRVYGVGLESVKRVHFIHDKNLLFKNLVRQY